MNTNDPIAEDIEDKPGDIPPGEEHHDDRNRENDEEAEDHGEEETEGGA